MGIGLQVKGVVCVRFGEEAMKKASQFEVCSEEELAGVDKTTAAIDVLLGKYHGTAALAVSNCPLHIAAEVGNRYRNAGWNVTTDVEGKGTYIIRVVHPTYSAELSSLVEFTTHRFDFSKPDVSPTTPPGLIDQLLSQV